MATVYLALGTNLGNRLENLRKAFGQLAPIVKIQQKSSVYETEPWGVTNQPRFLNQVVQAETKLSAEDLLFALKQLEKDMGRTEGVRYGPRVIDLDILFYDDLSLKTDNLEIPHPRIAERRFVLVPLAEIAPALIHPILQVSTQDLLNRLPNKDDVKKFV